MLATPTIVDHSVAGLVHTYMVGMNGDAVNELARERLLAIQKKAQIKGFRRGKAPLSVIRNHHGRRVTAAIIERSAVNVAGKLVIEEGLQPAGRPIIEICNEGKQVGGQINFVLTLEVVPQVELKSIDNLELVRLSVESGEGDEESNLLGRSRELSRRHLKQQIFDRLVRDYTFDVPADAVGRERERIERTYRDTIDDHVSPDLNEQFRALAERRVRLAILLTAIGRHHQIDMPREEVERLVEAQADRYPDDELDIVNFYIDHPTALAELQSALYEDRVVDRILRNATIHDRAVTAEELIAACEGESNIEREWCRDVE